MRLRYITTLAAVAAVTTAKPPHYVHRHAHAVTKRDARSDNVVYAPAATVTKYVFQLDNRPISEEEVRQGVANGTLQWGEDGNLSTFTKGPVALATPPPIPEHQVHSTEADPKPKPEEQLPQAPPPEKPLNEPTPTPPPNPSLVQPSDTSSEESVQLVDKDGHCASCDREFPNNTILCNEFPYGYGALPLANEGLGGWSGIQDPQYRGSDGFDDITTIPKGSCADGSCCRAGTFCSYGCPNPYLKNSFPKMQGRTGQSVGGLYCNKNGFLEMADGSIGNTLCGPDSKSMKVKVHNKLKKPVSICRTDYPGTESMTFPLTVQPGEIGFLANPDQGKYYFWRGKPTSAHYYINKQGVPESEACTWGQELKGKGNWSPTIIGTSFDDRESQMGYSSLKQNELCKSEKLDYDINFTGNKINAPCSYNKTTDQYCQGDQCWGDRDRGCTASMPQGGTLTIVLSE